ncbi:MAG: hypothetical protein JXA13_16695 [Anaerolineales bacterium]|nr:hypothetical protein [Anaerolineales bacterium]
MPGLHTVVLDPGKDTLQINFEGTLVEDTFSLDTVVDTPKCRIAISHYCGYPYSVWKDGNTVIVLDGMIYNFTDEQIHTLLADIAVVFTGSRDYRKAVKAFVDQADGDYVIEIWDKVNCRLLVFNDHLGRLSFYYYVKQGIGIFSRELKVLLEHMPQIKLDKSGLVDYLTLRYNLGPRMVFQDVYRLQASEMLVLEAGAGGMNLEVANSTEFNLDLDSLFASREESLEYLKDAFLAGTENRVRTLSGKEYHLVSDLSGGYDTRAVLGGLSKYAPDVIYMTVKSNTLDESQASEAIFKTMGSPGKLFIAENTFVLHSLEQLTDLVYRTDGMVNYQTTSICYQDSWNFKQEAPVPSARFLGLGGEFIRHPLKIYAYSPYSGFRNGLYISMPIATACKMIRADKNEYLENLKTYLDSYPERTKQGKLRRLYYEYYRQFVAGSAEDRERLHFWTVAPLWGLEFTRAIFTRLPLYWTGYKYCIQFLEKLDPRLLKAPIHGSDIQLDSKENINRYESRYRFGLLRTNLKAALPAPLLFYRSLRTLGRKLCSQKNTFQKYFSAAYYSYDFAQDVFDYASIEEDMVARRDVRLEQQVGTMLMYLHEIRKRYGEKLVL